MLLFLAAGCSKQKSADLSLLAWLPATTTALSLCPGPAAGLACRTTVLGRRFSAIAAAAPGVPGLQEDDKTYRERRYATRPNPLAKKSGTPAEREAWARFVLPNGQAVEGGEAAVMDVIDVVA